MKAFLSRGRATGRGVARTMAALAVCLAALVAGCAPASADPADPPAAAGQLTAQGYLQAYADQMAAVGYAELADGQITDTSYAGYANRETGLAADQNTVFEWGSISKLVVWVSVLQLVEQATLDLEADIGHYLPADFVWNRPGPLVTLTDLMNHTGGWADAIWDLSVADPQRVPDLRTALERTAPPVLYPPGTRVAYSNYAAALAGYIVERVSGQPFWQYARDHVFIPAGMADTTIEPTQADRSDLGARRDAQAGYAPSGDGVELIAGHRQYITVYPAGSALGTVEDLARFAQALLPPPGQPGPLFSRRATLDALFTPTRWYPDGTPANAHGLWAQSREGHLWWSHAGNTVAASSNLLINPATRRAVVVATNVASESLATDGLVTLILGPLTPPATPARGPGAPTAEQCAGLFVPTRRFADTAVSLVAWLAPALASADGPTTLTVNGTNLPQVAPFVFGAPGIGTIWCAVDAGSVTLSQPHVEYESVSPVYFGAHLGLVAASLISVAGAAVVLIASGVRGLIRRPSPSRLRRGRNLAQAALVGFAVNLGALVWRVAPGIDVVWVHYLPHFLVNGALAVAAVAYLVWLVRAWPREPGWRGKALAVGAGLGLASVSAAVIVFNLWR